MCIFWSLLHSNINVMLFHWVSTKHRAMNAYVGVKIYRHSFLTSALDGYEWSACRLGRLNSLETSPSVPQNWKWRLCHWNYQTPVSGKEKTRFRRKRRTFGFPRCFHACNCSDNHHWQNLSCSLTQVWKAGGRHLVDTFRAASFVGSIDFLLRLFAKWLCNFDL